MKFCFFFLGQIRYDDFTFTVVVPGIPGNRFSPKFSQNIEAVVKLVKSMLMKLPTYNFIHIHQHTFFTKIRHQQKQPILIMFYNLLLLHIEFLTGLDTFVSQQGQSLR